MTPALDLANAIRFRRPFRFVRQIVDKLSRDDLHVPITRSCNNFTELALYHRRYRVMRLLALAKGVKINLARYLLLHRRTPDLLRKIRYLLHNAEFLEDGIDATYRGRTAFSYACEFCSTSVVLKLLIRKGANVNAVDSRGFTPVMHASQNNFVFLMRRRVDVERLLIRKKSKKLFEILYLDETPPLTGSFMRKVVENFSYVVNRQAKLAQLVDDHGNTVIHWAVKLSRLYVVGLFEDPLRRDLLKVQNHKGETPLHCCRSQTHYRELVAWGADPHVLDKKLVSPYCKFSPFGDHLSACELLFYVHRPALDFLAGTNDDPLCLCLEEISIILVYFDKPQVERLCQLRDSAGDSLLHVAVYTDNLTAVRHILQHTGDLLVNAKNSCGRTPLHFAEHPVARDLLIENDAHPDVVDMFGELSSHVPLSLQCAAARNIRYSDMYRLPKRLLSFVQLHKPNKR